MLVFSRASHLTFISKLGLAIPVLGLLIVLAPTNAAGQTQDQDPKTGTYTGASFASSQIESVNITNGNLLVDLPLASLPAGRSGLRAGVRLSYNSKLWTTETEQFPDCVNHLVNQTFLYEGDEGGWRYNFRYEPELLSNQQGNNKLQFRFPDGSVHVLMPLGSTGDPSGYYPNLPSNQTYVSTDATYSRSNSDLMATRIGVTIHGQSISVTDQEQPEGMRRGASTTETITISSFRTSRGILIRPSKSSIR